MNAATIQHLADLKKAGFDVSSLEHQMSASPILNQRGDQLMGGGILRQAAFTKASQDRAEKIKELEDQIAELTTMQGAGVSVDSPIYKAALEVISEQEQLLINAGFSEDEVKKLSEKAVAKAPVVPTTKKEPPVVPPVKKEIEGNNDMDTSNFLDLDTFQQQSENQVFGNASLSALTQHAMLEAQKLGIEIPREKAANFGHNLRKALTEGKTIDQFVDDEFGLTAKRKEVDEANRKKEIDDARAAGKAEGFKEAGVPRRVVTRTGKHPIYDNITSRREVGQQQQEKQDDGNKEIPTNKWGDKEIYRTRGDKFSRIQAAEDYHEKVLERTAAQDSIPSE